ncbi:MAG: DJ-1/PfpI family protein, partial [Tissierella sp.]|uniref:DJ-1/PfpI family protein n=1 Tax=Tissierella sp. TaxID=41274 RepID=UPI003F943C76
MKIMVFLAEGFEEVEALTVVDYLRRVDIEVDTVSITKEKNVKGAHGIEVVGDKLLKDLNIDEYTGLVIPGGLPGATNLRDSKELIEIVEDFNKKEKLIAAICAGP